MPLVLPRKLVQAFNRHVAVGSLIVEQLGQDALTSSIFIKYGTEDELLVSVFRQGR